jgi:hypothetical protein
LDAAGGDSHQALLWALEDLLRAEQALEAACGLISYGYARGGLTAARKRPQDRAACLIERNSEENDLSPGISGVDTGTYRMIRGLDEGDRCRS